MLFAPPVLDVPPSNWNLSPLSRSEDPLMIRARSAKLRNETEVYVLLIISVDKLTNRSSV